MSHRSVGSLLFVVGLLGGCAQTADPTCGLGRGLTYNGVGLCYYDSPVVVETGFDCPAEMPHMRRTSGGVVCSEQEIPQDDAELIDDMAGDPESLDDGDGPLPEGDPDDLAEPGDEGPASDSICLSDGVTTWEEHGGIVEEMGFVGGTLVFDETGGQLIHYGGFTPEGELSGRVFIGDGGGEWLMGEAPEGGPVARAGHGAVFDPAQRAMIVFGGLVGDREPLAYSNEVWALLVGETEPQWIQVSVEGDAPAPRSGSAVVWDSTNQRIIVIGGVGASLEETSLITTDGLDPDALDGGGDGGSEEDTGETFSDVFALAISWDGSEATGVWAEITPSSSRIPGADWSGAYDEENQRVLIFGGRVTMFPASMIPLSQTWALNLATTAEWELIDEETEGEPSSPNGRFGHLTAYDSENQRLIVFGGASLSLSGEFYLGDLWELDLSGETPSWANCRDSEDPGSRGYLAGVRDATTGTLWVMGGQTADGPSVSLWSLQ